MNKTEQDGCVALAIISIISLKARRAYDTLFSRAFHKTSRYDFRANDIRPPDQCQILCGASLGRGNNILFAASGSHDQDGHHAHIW